MSNPRYDQRERKPSGTARRNEAGNKIPGEFNGQNQPIGHGEANNITHGPSMAHSKAQWAEIFPARAPATAPAAPYPRPLSGPFAGAPSTQAGDFYNKEFQGRSFQPQPAAPTPTATPSPSAPARSAPQGSASRMGTEWDGMSPQQRTAKLQGMFHRPMDQSQVLDSGSSPFNFAGSRNITSADSNGGASTGREYDPRHDMTAKSVIDGVVRDYQPGAAVKIDPRYGGGVGTVSHGPATANHYLGDEHGAFRGAPIAPPPMPAAPAPTVPVIPNIQAPPPTLAQANADSYQRPAAPAPAPVPAAPSVVYASHDSSDYPPPAPAPTSVAQAAPSVNPARPAPPVTAPAFQGAKQVAELYRGYKERTDPQPAHSMSEGKVFNWGKGVWESPNPEIARADDSTGAPDDTFQMRAKKMRERLTANTQGLRANPTPRATSPAEAFKPKSPLMGPANPMFPMPAKSITDMAALPASAASRMAQLKPVTPRQKATPLTGTAMTAPFKRAQQTY